MVKEKNLNETSRGRIEIQNLTKAFSSPLGDDMTALDDVSFSVEPGDFIILLGPSGCGKTTLLRMIAGLETPTSGSICLDREEIHDTSFERGFVFQDPELFKWLNIEQNVAFGLKARKVYEQRKDDVQKFIDLVGLTGFEKVYPHQLSGGMAQRASLARAIINHPKVLLLDEPFGALDAFTRLEMQCELLKIWNERRMTMIMVTHDIDEAIFLSTKIIVMSQRPAKVKKILENNLPYPRTREQQDFSKLRNEIISLLDFTNKIF